VASSAGLRGPDSLIDHSPPRGEKLPSLDDTAAIQAAFDDAVAGATVFFPQMPRGYVVKKPIRAWSDGAKINGVLVEGEGANPTGYANDAPTIFWGGNEPSGFAAQVAERQLDMIRITGMSGLTADAVGDTFELWGCVHTENNGRLVLCQLIDPTSGWFHNAIGISPDPGTGGSGFGWRWEQGTLDIRAPGIGVKNLHFDVVNLDSGHHVASYFIQWTQSPLANAPASTLSSYEKLLLINSRAPGTECRWGIRIATAMLPLPGNFSYSADGNGRPVPIAPDNCDLSRWDRCTFGYLREAGIFIDGNLNGGFLLNPALNGNAYGHMVNNCGFEVMPFGVEVLAGGANLYECSASAVGMLYAALSIRTVFASIIGGHDEVCSMIVLASRGGFRLESVFTFMDIGQLGAPTYRWNPNYASNLNSQVVEQAPYGLNPFGRLTASTGDFSVEGCYWGCGDFTQAFHACNGGTPSLGVQKANIRNNVYGGNSFASGQNLEGGGPAYFATRFGPWSLVDGTTIDLKIDGGATHTYTIHGGANSNFPNLARAFPVHLAYDFHAWASGLGLDVDAFVNGTSVVIHRKTTGFGNGGGRTLEILSSSTAAAELGLPFGVTNGVDLGPAYSTTNGIVDHVLGSTNATGSISSPFAYSYGIHVISEANTVQGSTDLGGYVAEYGSDEVNAFFGTLLVAPAQGQARKKEFANCRPAPSLQKAPCHNLGGLQTIAGTKSSAVVLFDVMEIDAAYQVHVHDYSSVQGLAHPIPAGAFNAHPIGLSTKGFVLQLDATPGTGNSVTYAWDIRRGPTTSYDDPVDPTIITTAPLVGWYDPLWQHVFDPGNNLTIIKDRSASAADLPCVTAIGVGPVLPGGPPLGTTNAGLVPDFNSGPNGFPFFRFFESKAQGTHSVLSATTFYMMVVYRVNMPSTNSFPYFPYPGSIGGSAHVFAVNGVYFGNTGLVPARYVGYDGFSNFTDAAPVFDRNWHLAEFFLTAGSPNTMHLLIDGVNVPLAGAFAYPAAPINTIVALCQDEGNSDVALALVWNGDISGDANIATLRAGIRNKYGI
jgi:hypothetical protein